MRITGGQFRSRVIHAPKGTNVRPTTDKTRQAIFNILTAARWDAEGEFLLDGACVLDLFCGTGAMGLEAISRGAGSCIFVDKDKASLSFARENASTLGVAGSTHFLLKDATKPGGRPPAIPEANLVFIDPPYRKNMITPALVSIAENGWLAPSAIVVIESEKDWLEEGVESMPFDLIDRRAYGGTMLSIMRFRSADR